jgi:arginase
MRPYVEETDVVALGFYDDPADAADYRTEAIHQSGIQTIAVEEVRRLGAHEAALEALQRLTRPGLKGFWIHLDADVLDQTVMPAVDSPNPKGLIPEELRSILQTLLESGHAVGLEVTILDPELDPDGEYVADFARLLLATLT